MTTLYEIYAGNENFDFPVFVDSKLSCDICNLYSEILKDDNLRLWEKVSKWKNVKFISDKTDSMAVVADKEPKIIISSSGFCTNGRIVNYLKNYLRDLNSTIIFSGFTGDNPSYLSYRVKNYREHKFISINKEKIPNKADCVTLSSFSSHANYTDLVTYGSSLNTNKVILVHGSTKSKSSLSAALSDAISKNNKTYKVISAYRGLIVNL